MKRLGKIINRPGVFILSASAESAEYAKFLKMAQHPYIFGPAYSGLSQVCIHVLERTLLIHNRFHEKVAYTFEKGDREHELVKTINEYERQNDLRDLRSHMFLPKDTILLQPADLIAGTIQHVLLRASVSVKCLDNGRICTPVDNFERYYSKDGVSASVIPSYNGTLLRVVVNKPLFGRLDAITTDVLERKPEFLRKRLKEARNQGKRKRKGL